jgi:hypothetical protein
VIAAIEDLAVIERIGSRTLLRWCQGRDRVARHGRNEGRTLSKQTRTPRGACDGWYRGFARSSFPGWRRNGYSCEYGYRVVAGASRGAREARKAPGALRWLALVIANG